MWRADDETASGSDVLREEQRFSGRVPIIVDTLVKMTVKVPWAPPWQALVY